MIVDMFGFKRQHKLITSEGMDMIKRQIECDNHNATEVWNMKERHEIDYIQFSRYSKAFNVSEKQQKYALEKGRFR